MLNSVFLFFKTGVDFHPFGFTQDKIKKMYERKRYAVIFSITFGYGFYYVCRLSLSVAKKALIDGGILNARELGIMGSALFFSYAFGKFFNGFLADRSNVKRFMSFGLLASALANLLLGFTSYFWFFVILWGFNGWFQSMGAAPSVVAMSYWFSNKERGTCYGIWATSHNIGEAMTFVVTAFIINSMGWKWGFWAPGLVGILGVFVIYLFLQDRPATFGLPTIADYKNDHGEKLEIQENIGALQLEVIKNPAVWMLGLSSAFFYVARYAVTSWGVLFLQEQKAYTDVVAASIVSANPILGILGTVLSGYISDRFFSGRRNIPALIFGIMYSCSIATFLLVPKGHLWVDVLSMSVFGFALGALLCYLGGLMAVDICSKRASGAALGMIGIFSYLAAAIQDIVSGYFIEASKIIVNGKAVYDFSIVTVIWMSASVLSLLFALTVWKVKYRE